MYQKSGEKKLLFEEFYLPFGGKLRSANRWVELFILGLTRGELALSMSATKS